MSEMDSAPTNNSTESAADQQTDQPTNQQQSTDLLNVVDLLNERIRILETRCEDLESQLAACNVQLETEIRKRQLNRSQREQVIDAVENGATAAKVSREFNVHPKTVYNIVKSQKIFRKKYDNSNRFLLNAQDKVDINELKGESLRSIQAKLSSNVSIDTIDRHFKREGCKTYVKLNKNNLDRVPKDQRLKFAREYGSWGIEEWKRVIFTDETTIKNRASKEYVRCRPDERFQVTYYNRRSARQLSVNLWGFVNFYEKKLFRISSNFNRTEMFELLFDCGVLDYIKLLVPGPLYYQQDNCKVHLTSENLNIISLKGFILIKNWPSWSPDLNPIEVVWAILKKKVYLRLNEIEVNNEDELFDVCEQCFNDIDQQTIQQIISKLPLIIDEVFEIDGDITKN